MWFLIAAGCASELFTITLEQSTETEIAGFEMPDPGGGVLPEAEELDLSELMHGVSGDVLRDRGVEPGDISDLFVDRIHLRVLSPADADLAFLDSLELYVSAPDLPDALVAFGDEFPDGVADVDLEVEGVDLEPYLMAEGMEITPVGAGLPPGVTTRVRATLGVSIGVTARGILGQLDQLDEIAN